MFKNIKELARVFLKLGFFAFGGPAAHIAMMEDEIVTKRKWMTHQHFMDLISATNLIPGPNSTEMAIHTGYHKGKIPGLITAGLCFILPAVLLTGIIAYFYVQYGNLPEVKPFIYGIKPTVIVIILNAVYKLGKTAAKEIKLFSIAVVVALINLLGVNEIFSILLGGILGAFFIIISERKNVLNSFVVIPFLTFFAITPVLYDNEKSQVSLVKLFLIFLKIGAVLFGSGYVLVAYLNGELVQGLNWLNKQQLLDAIAVGQFTPGPVLSTATFVGYQIAGTYGAILATIGIFLPSFIFVLLVNPIIPRLRNAKIVSVFLNAVNASSLAIMFVVAIKLSDEVLINTAGGTNWRTAVIAIICAVAFLKFRKINSAYIVLGGAVLGYLLQLI